MAFDLDFSHVPTIAGIPTTPTVTSGVSAKSVDIMNRFTSDPGSLFQNPLTNAYNTFGGSVTRLETAFTQLSTGELVSPSISANQAQEFLDADGFEASRSAIGNLMMHVNRLSGVTKSFGLDQPGLKDILSIGMQMQNMMTLLNSARGCMGVLGGATGLFSEDSINNQANKVAEILNRVTGGIATVADVAETLQVAANTFLGIIDKDSLFLQSCINQLQTAAVGMAMEAINSNPCGHFIFEQISNRNPGGILNVLGQPIAKI
jgi:hypothetical protein